MPISLKPAMIRIKGSAELFVFSQIEVISIHELLLLGPKPSFEKALESGLLGGPEKEAISYGKVERG